MAYNGKSIVKADGCVHVDYLNPDRCGQPVKKAVHGWLCELHYFTDGPKVKVKREDRK